MDLKEGKKEVLRTYFGYDSFREGQEVLIDALLSGRDALGIMPTGAGKSICYQVPALMLPGLTVVVSPLISLMHDQVKALNAAGVHAAYINSSLTEGQITKALGFAMQGRYKIIYVAPERLLTSGFLTFARAADISLLTVDEAHCISQWGQDFRPSYLHIVDFLKELPKRPVVGAFTATATPQVKEDIWAILGLKNPEVLLSGFDRPNLYFEVEDLRGKEKDDFVLSYVKEHREESGIIYCATRKKVDELFTFLFKEGVSVARYHAGMESEERTRSQQSFVEDECPVMVATNAFGMGIDKSNVRFVLHYNMPSCMENYYQEAGRAGRDGMHSQCILLYSPQDVVIQRYLLERKDFSQVDSEDALLIQERDKQRLRAMEEYCSGTSCLRNRILSYFGEHPVGECGNCGICQGSFEERDVTTQAKEMVSCAGEMRGRYGKSLIIEVLRGSNTSKVRERNLSSLEAFGKLSGTSQELLSSLAEKLVREGYLSESGDKYRVLGIGPLADKLLQGETSVSLRIKEKASAGEKKMVQRNSLTSAGFELFERLRSVRTQVARENHVAPYIVFSDKTLIDMCVKKPRSEAELLTVNGVATRKASTYGPSFLAEIEAFISEKGDMVTGEEESVEVEDKGEESKKRERKRERKLPFLLTPEVVAGLSFSPLMDASVLRDLLNGVKDEKQRRLSAKEIYAYFAKAGYLTPIEAEGIFYPYVVSERGRAAGIEVEEKTSQKGMVYENHLFPESLCREAALFFTTEEWKESLKEEEG